MRTLEAMADDLPTGRWRRAAKVGRLAGGQTARGYATKAAVSYTHLTLPTTPYV